MNMRGRGPANTTGGGVSGTTAASAAALAAQMEERSKWVNVTWMPHASLSQSSHISFAVRSILTSLDVLRHYEPEEWQVQATIHGMAGQSIVPISSRTPKSPVIPIQPDHPTTTTTSSTTEMGGNPPSLGRTNYNHNKNDEWFPLTSNATHICKLDSLVHVPIRWRDLPRDAYLRFEILSLNDEVVSLLIGGQQQQQQSQEKIYWICDLFCLRKTNNLNLSCFS